jgi:hypothetical protein
MGDAKQGFLVLADISGFTAFVTATELEHGPPIIAALLDEVIARIAPPLEVREIEGDAIFALGTVVPPAMLLEVLRGGLRGFQERRRQLAADDSCSCRACRDVWRLRLKMIVHHGTFLDQLVGSRVQAAGRDVILVHRLLKNGVTRAADYTLLTRPAVRYMGVDPGEIGLVPHSERYEHFGTVECFVEIDDVRCPPPQRPLLNEARIGVA